MPCTRCEVAERGPTGPLTLRLWSPLGHSEAKLARIASAAGAAARREDESGALAIETCDARWPRLREGFECELSSVEREAVRLIATRTGDPAPTLRDLAKVVTLEQHIIRLRSDWLIRRLDSDALSVGFEPVAYADAPEEIFANAAVVRAEDDAGRAVAAADLFDLARGADFLAALDRAARLSAIRAIAEARIEGPVFVDFAPSAIYDPRFCLRTTLSEAERCGVTREAVVFSILSADGGANVDHLQDVLGYYVDQGFRTAMTLSTRREASFEMLQRLRPNVLVIEAGLVEGVRQDPSREVVARKLIEIAHRLQLDTVVKGVDTEEDCEWAYSHGASYVQGAFVAGAAMRRAS